jgi:predicted  nucleic acid-binding Zn-ribbon protein
VRGKHRAISESRRDRTALEHTATDAERRAERSEKALAIYKAATDRTLEGLRAELAQAIKDRERSASPALARAEARTDELTQEVAKLQLTIRNLKSSRESFVKSVGSFVAAALASNGASKDEISRIETTYRENTRNWLTGQFQRHGARDVKVPEQPSTLNAAAAPPTEPH